MKVNFLEDQWFCSLNFTDVMSKPAIWLHFVRFLLNHSRARAAQRVAKRSIMTLGNRTTCMQRTRNSRNSFFMVNMASGILIAGAWAQRRRRRRATADRSDIIISWKLEGWSSKHIKSSTKLQLSLLIFFVFNFTYFKGNCILCSCCSIIAGPNGRQVEHHYYRNRITCKYRTRNSCNSLFKVNMASEYRSRARAPNDDDVTTSRNMAATLQPIPCLGL